MWDLSGLLGFLVDFGLQIAGVVSVLIGIACYKGRFDLDKAFYAIVGTFLIVGGPAIVELISGGVN